MATDIMFSSSGTSGQAAAGECEGGSCTRASASSYRLVMRHLHTVASRKLYAIQSHAPASTEMSTTAQQLLTGIKVVALLVPYAKGGKIGLFGGAAASAKLL